MSIEIKRPGILSTVQDLGRIGYRSIGIGPGGAMDVFAASVANLLVGNDEGSPVIELHFPAAEMLFREDAIISITGANFSAHIDADQLPLWRPVLIKKNTCLFFKKFISGARVYISIHGGIRAERWLDSYSTHTKIKRGGHKGRQLLKEDVVSFGSTLCVSLIESFPDLTGMISPVYQSGNSFRCLPGPEWALLSDESKTVFSQAPFSITSQSDRMGYRLKGIGLKLNNPVQLVSSPVDFGTIQLLSDGQLIILMADHQTTGGYPRIAQVISADLPQLAQSPVHHELYFKMRGIEDAEDALFSTHQTLRSIRAACKNYYHANRP